MRFIVLAWLLSSAPTTPTALSPAPTAMTVPATSRPMSAAQRRAVIDALIAQLRANYVFPERLPAIARALRQPGGTDADPEQFAQRVNAGLARSANDRHLRLIWSPEAMPPPPTPGSAEGDRELARMREMMNRKNFAIPTAEVLAGNVGYLRLDLFARAERAGATLAAAMAFLQHSDALIIDLRENGGGDPAMVALALSYLVPPDTQLNAFHLRGQAADQQVWSLPYVPGGRWSLDRPVFVLMSRRTASGAEEFAYDLQQLKRATIIGEPSWGGANPGGLFPIDNHFAVFVPTAAAVNPISHTNWEGVGVHPDVAADPATALPFAHRLALTKLLATATGDRREELRAALEALGR